MNPDQHQPANHGERRSNIPALTLRALLPVVLLVVGWVGYAILSVEPEAVAAGI